VGIVKKYRRDGKEYDVQAVMVDLADWHTMPPDERSKRIAAARLHANQEAAIVDIVRCADERGLTPKQVQYLGSLLEQVLRPQTKPVAGKLAATSATIFMPNTKQLLDRGKGIVLMTAHGETVKFKYTGVNYTQYPGSYHINNSFGYVGRLDPAGGLHLRVDAIAPTLMAIECDPMGACIAYAQATNHCCFCGRELTDEPSVAAGYGPVCAEKYGLPWGEDKVELTYDMDF
jgi:hypothetical protein